MKLMLFSIYDMKVESFSGPFCCRTYGEAERFFEDLRKDPQSQYVKHPEDYQLYHVGLFDQSSGMVSSRDEVERVYGLEVSNA